MSWLWATGVVIAFAASLEFLELPTRAREVGRRARRCLRLLRDPTLTDDQKESELQRHALRLFALLGLLAGGSVLALALPLGAVWGMDRVGWASFPSVWATLQRLDFLGAVSIGGGGLWLVYRRWR